MKALDLSATGFQDGPAGEVLANPFAVQEERMYRKAKWHGTQALGLAALALVGSLASAQQPGVTSSPISNCPSQGGTPYNPSGSWRPTPGGIGTAPGMGTTPGLSPGPATGTDPGTSGGTAPGTGAGAPTSTGADSGTGTAGTSFAGLSSGAGVGSSAALNGAPGGYLDSAIPKTTFRLRYDAGFDLNRPDRASYFYGAWSELSFHPHGINNGGVFFAANAPGPNILPGHVNYQEASAYQEVAFGNRFSVFAEGPYRFINFQDLHEDNPESELKRLSADAPSPGSKFFPEPANSDNNGPPKNNFNGWSDLQVGFKYAILADPDQYLTFQFRTYLPTGKASEGLGTGHVSLEPSLLFYQRLGERVTFQAQLTDWIPVDGGPIQGNVLSYGVGLGYDVYCSEKLRITPITEFVGWTVLNGYESFFGAVSATAPPGLELPLTHGVADAGGNTIINGKIGVRTYFGEWSDLYIGYGRALTGDRWYKDIVRVEYRINF
jgi:hypothetical protein